MSMSSPNSISTVALLSIVACLTLSLGGCAKKQLSSIRDDRPLTSGVQLPAEENRRIENLPMEEVLQRGWSALYNGEEELATLYFTAALNKEPKSVPARLGLGQAALATGNYDKARILIDEVLIAEPTSLPALTARGRIFSAQGKLNDAIADFTSCLNKEPDNIPLLTELAMTLERIPQRLAEAEPLYRKVLELSPESALARNNLGFNLLLQGRIEEATTILSQALALDAKHPRIVANLAAAHLLKGDKARALQLFRQTLGEAEAYNNIGYLYMTQSCWEEAESSFRKALELSPRYYVRAGANLERLQELRVAASKEDQPD